MSLAWNQLPGGCDGEMLRSQSEFRAYLPAVCSAGKSINVDGAANDFEPLVFYTPVSQHVGNRFRNCNDLAEGPVTQAGDKSQFRIIDPARNHRRNVRKARGKPSQDICAAATMAMHDIGPLLLEELRETVAEGQIEIAGAEEILHTNFRLACDGVNPGIRRTDEDVLMATFV
jgi:hypothetical protein